MPIRTNRVDKDRPSIRPADIPRVMTDPMLVSPASSMDHKAVSGLFFGSI